MTLTVRDVDPSVSGRIRCRCCMRVMDLGDAVVCGDCMICPHCGEWEAFEIVEGG